MSQSVSKATWQPAPATSPVVQKYATNAPTMIVNNGIGGPGVQFGAFSSHESANSMAMRIKNTLGATAYIEPTGTGLYRVRVGGLTDASATELKNRATSAGIDCFVFH